MKKSIKAALITAACLIGAGLIVMFCAFGAAGFRFANLSTDTYSEKSYPIHEPIRNISIDATVTDIRFVPSSADQLEVVCTESDNTPYQVSVENGTLTVREQDDRHWYDRIGLFWGAPKIEILVRLPEGQYDALHVTSTAGDITVPAEFRFAQAHLETTVGDISYAAPTDGDLTVKSTVGDTLVFCPTVKNLSVTSTTGDIELLGVTAAGRIQVSSTVGEIDLNHCDADTLELETTTGDVEAKLLSGKAFDARSTTGDVELPHSSQGGSCRIRTKTGDIEVTIG